MMKTPVIYYGAIAAFCVLTLCIGMVNAAHMTQPATNWTDKPGMGHGHTLAPDEMIAHLEQQGVDVTEVKTLLQNGNTTSVKTWLDAYRDSHKDQIAHKGHMQNFTRQPNPEMIIEHLEQQGVGVSEAKTLLQKGDTTAVKIWLEANRPAHAGFPKGSAHPGFDLTNVTMQQQMITRFEQQGTDVSGLQAAFQSGDTTAVKAWLDTYRDTHKDQMNNCRMNRRSHAQATQ